MLETSQDLFYLVLAFCVLWFTIFLCWCLYYLIRLLRQTNQILTEMREKFAKLTNVISLLRNKLFVEGAEGLMHWFSEKKATQKTKSKK